MPRVPDADKIKAKQSRETTVYALHNSDRGATKIGRAVNPQIRRRNLQTGNHSELDITFIQPVDKAIATKVERTARDLAEYDLKKSRTREWLSDTTPEEAEWCIRVAYEQVRGNNGTAAIMRMRRKVMEPGFGLDEDG